MSFLSTPTRRAAAETRREAALVPTAARRSAQGTDVRMVCDPVALAHPARHPPALGVHHAVADLLREAQDESAALGIILRACRLRLTTPDRLRDAAGAHARMRRRRLIDQVCGHVDVGQTRPLELATADPWPVGTGCRSRPGSGGSPPVTAGPPTETPSTW